MKPAGHLKAWVVIQGMRLERVSKPYGPRTTRGSAGVREALAGVRPRLEVAFPERLKGIFLYGSEAREEAGPDSDLDLLVVLRGPVSLGQDLDRIVRALYPMQLDLDRPIHALPASEEAFEAGEYAIYRSVRREGIAL
jgi:predicted nucleotidyltransferase